MSALAYKFEEDPEVAVQTAMDSAREAIQEHPTLQGRNEFLEAARLEVIAIHKAVEADSDLKFAQLARMARQANKAKAYNVIVAMMKFIQHHAEVAESNRIRFQQEVDKLRLQHPTPEGEVMSRALEIQIQLFVWTHDLRISEYEKAYKLARKYRPLGKGPIRSFFAQTDEEYLEEVRERLIEPSAETLEWARSVAAANGIS